MVKLDKKLNLETKKFDAVSNNSDYFGFIRTSWKNGLSADLLEICFLTNKKDFNTYIENKEAIADGLARAIVEGFGKTYKTAEKPVKKKNIGSGRINKKRVDVKY